MRGGVFLLLWFAASAAAQPPDHLAPEQNVLYAHNQGPGFPEHIMQVRPHTNSTAILYEGPFVDEALTVPFTLTPPIEYNITLDAEATIGVTAHIGGGQNHVGQATVSTRIEQGQRLVGSGAAVTHTLLPSGPESLEQPYATVTWRLPVQVSELVAHQPLQWILQFESVSGGGLFIGTSDLRGNSRIELPVTEVAEPAAGGGEAAPLGAATAIAAVAAAAWRGKGKR